MVINMAKQRTYSKFAVEAVQLLGKQIKLARKQRRWSEQHLAERADISRATLQKIEKGEMTCSIGLVFETAALVGLNLFDNDQLPISVRLENTTMKIALLPQRIKPEKRVVDDDF